MMNEKDEVFVVSLNKGNNGFCVQLQHLSKDGFRSRV